MKPIVPVVFATDDKFASCCSVSIASLIANCDKKRLYKIYVFYDELSHDNQDKLRGMSQENVSVEMIQVTKYVDEKLFYVHGTQTIATYFRLFAADVLQQHDKILYLDSDIVVLGDVGELYDIDIGDNLLGGVVIFRNKPEEIMLKQEYLKNTFDITPEQFINAGILSMNLKLFREEGIKEKCLIYLQEHRNLRWMDQDVLNGVCKGRIHYLPEIWNKSQFYLEEDLMQNGDVEDVAIVHYLDRFKPWLVPFQRPHLYFYQYVLHTPYHEELTRMILENNRFITENERLVEEKERVIQEKERIIREMNEAVTVDRERALVLIENMCEQRIIGPRYLFRGAKAWLRGRINGIRNRVRKG